MKLISVAEMRDLEEKADEAGYTYAEMMKTAGEGIARYIEKIYQIYAGSYVLGLVGKGNNGGDTLVALTSLQSLGWHTRVILIHERTKGDALVQAYLESGGEVIDEFRWSTIPNGRGLLLDGIFGTGFKPPLPEKIIQVLAEIKRSLPELEWIAVDCPSGVDCERGEVSEGTIGAHVTVCLEAVKKGMLTYSAFPYAGELVTVDLGIAQYLDQTVKSEDVVVTKDLVKGLLPKRNAFAHKGSYGKTLVIGGSVNYPGAPVLAGRGAYAVGTGLVQVAVPVSIYQSAQASTLELTWAILEDAGGIISEIAAETVLPFELGSNSLVIGPGLGREDSTKRFLHNLLLPGTKTSHSGAGFPGVNRQAAKESELVDLPPLVIDADGLYLLAQDDRWFEKMGASAILTPHPGEMAQLTGLPVEEIQNNRMEIAREFAVKWRQTVILKGALTVIADATGRIAVVPIATSSLAKAGTGDVLAGMLAGLLAQGLRPWEAALVGAWLHGQAGIAASEIVGCEESVLATDVIRAIPKVYSRL